MSTVTVPTRECFVCNAPGTVTVSEAGYTAWRAGILVQDAFPEVPAPVREQLKSGVHPECWTRMFGTGPA